MLWGALFLNEQGMLEAKPRQMKQTVQTIDEWTDAFIIFISIFIEKYPHENQALLKYMSIIRDASRRYPVNSWTGYDQQFRIRQAIPALRQSWAMPHSSLWFLKMTSPPH